MENPEVSCDDELPLSHIVDEEDFRSYCANEQKSSEEKIEIPVLVALRERMFKKTSNFDWFVLKLALLCDLDQALSLAQVAVCDLQILEQMVIVLLVVQVKVDVMDSESFFSK
ncbi:unnamed protein product [Brassica rapa subsp. trilocularis]